MVNPTNGVGPLQGVQGTQRVENPSREPKENRVKEARDLEDVVQVSEEAISLQQAEEAAREVRGKLENSGYTLGLREGFE